MRWLTRLWVASGNKTSRAGRRYSAAHQAPAATFALDDEQKTDLSVMMEDIEESRSLDNQIGSERCKDEGKT